MTYKNFMNDPVKWCVQFTHGFLNIAVRLSLFVCGSLAILCLVASVVFIFLHMVEAHPTTAQVYSQQAIGFLLLSVVMLLECLTVILTAGVFGVLFEIASNTRALEAIEVNTWSLRRKKVAA